MNRALFAAASGMTIEQQNLDTIAANLASADVTAFTGQVVRARSAVDQQGRVSGAVPVGTELCFHQGRLEKSGGPCDVAIRGDGFFIVTRGNQSAYTRAGAFTRTTAGHLENADGWQLRGVVVPAAAEQLRIAADGTVSVVEPQGNRTIAHLQIATFAAPAKLGIIDPTTFCATPQSGMPQTIAAGQRGGPEFAFGRLERSSVSIVESMMEILDAQRAYEADAKGVQAADEMVRIANNLQRG